MRINGRQLPWHEIAAIAAINIGCVLTMILGIGVVVFVLYSYILSGVFGFPRVTIHEALMVTTGWIAGYIVLSAVMNSFRKAKS